MPVKVYAKCQPVAHINPPLVMGEVYRITDTKAISDVAGVGAYFVYNAANKDVTYLTQVNGGGYDRASTLEYNNVSFITVTLAEVSHV